MGLTTGLLRHVDDARPDSLSHRLRAKRFARFEAFTATMPRPLRLVDIGGTTEFWEQRGWADRDDVHITLVNLTAGEQRYEHIVPTAGDATRLDFPDGAFNVAFSNSVIEHLFTLEQQQAMAREVQRVARAYWVQTPNFWFPMEPHFLVPGWQWLPVAARVAILRRRPVGQAAHCPDRAQAERVVRTIRLMRRRELARLFPGALLVPERFGGAVKSWTAVSAS
jgi:Methyltransferase domain